MKNAVGYYRTSSAGNVGEDKDSHTRQKLAVENYAKKSGLKIIQDFYDAGVTGADAILQRKGFRELLKYADETGIRTILVESCSRFARDLIVAETGFQYLSGLGFKLIAVDSPKSFIEKTPTSNLVRQILGAVSQFQKDELVGKLASARLRKRELNKRNGKLTIEGKGKCEGRKSLKEMNPEMSKNAKRLYRRNPINGKRRSLREVGRMLQDMGFQKENGNPYGTDQIKHLM